MEAEDDMPSANEIAKPAWMMTLASTTIMVGELYLAKGFIVPFTLAVLLSFLLGPRALAGTVATSPQESVSS